MWSKWSIPFSCEVCMWLWKEEMKAKCEEDEREKGKRGEIWRLNNGKQRNVKVHLILVGSNFPSFRCGTHFYIDNQNTTTMRIKSSSIHSYFNGLENFYSQTNKYNSWEAKLKIKIVEKIVRILTRHPSFRNFNQPPTNPLEGEWKLVGACNPNAWSHCLTMVETLDNVKHSSR